MSENTIIRQRRRHHFVQIPNETARDPRLSWKATGLLCYLLSLPDDWKIRLSHLSSAKKDGRDGTRTGVAELEAAGYLRIIVQRDDANRIIGTVWEVSDFPDTEIPNTEKPNTEKPTLRIPSTRTPNLQTPPPARARGGRGGGEKKQPQKSETPTPPADSVGEDAGEAREAAGQVEQPDALREISVADSCRPFQAALASAASAAGLDRAGTQRLADALAGALAAPDGDPASLKNRNNPARWLASTAKAICAGEFIEGAAYLAAVASRQAKQAARRVASGEEDAEHRRRLEESAASVKIDPTALAAGRNLLTPRAERRA